MNPRDPANYPKNDGVCEERNLRYRVWYQGKPRKIGDLSLEEVRDWVGQAHPRSWAPRELRVLAEMPMLRNGKVDRRRLREEMLGEPRA